VFPHFGDLLLLWRCLLDCQQSGVCAGDLLAGRRVSIPHEQVDAAPVLHNVNSDIFVHRFNLSESSLLTKEKGKLWGWHNLNRARTDQNGT